MREELSWGSKRPSSGRRAVLYVLCLAALKGGLFLLDPSPKFFFGDSYCYLETATTGWIPPDRSFTYGFFIRATTFIQNSLWPLMAAQVLMGLGCSLGLAYVSRRYLGLKATWAGLTGLLCALEPIQLHYERAVMTECLSLFLFVAYITACLRYLEKGRLGFLGFLQFLGTCLISVRLSFLPQVLAFSILLPLIRWAFAGGESRGRSPKPLGSRKWWSKGLAHVIVSLALTLALHTGYKWLFAKLSGHAPGYAASTGYVLLATWAPVLKAKDFPDEKLGARLLESLDYDLRDPRLRNDQLFSPGGLVHRLKELLPDEIKAEAAARIAAFNALRRDPMGVAGLGMRTFLDFFDVNYLGKMIAEDLAFHQEDEYSNFREVFKERLSMVFAESQPMTWLRRYYLAAVPWYWALLLTPLVGLWAIFRAPLNRKGALFLLFLAGLLPLGSATFLAVQPVVRYLHPVAWVALALWGSLSPRVDVMLHVDNLRAKHIS